MTDERYDLAAETASQIVNLLSANHPGGKAQLFGAVLFSVLHALREMEGRLTDERLRPSAN